MQVNLLLNIKNNKKVTRSNSQNLAWYGYRNNGLKADTLSFGAKDICAPKNFQVKTLPNLYCPMCGVIMLREEDVKRLAKDLAERKGNSLISALDKLSSVQMSDGEESPYGIYRAEKKPIVNVYKKLAKKHPDKDLLELTQLHAINCMQELIKKQLLIVDEIKTYVEKNIPAEEQKEINEVILEYEKRIKGDSGESFYRKDFIDNIVGIVDDEYKFEVKEIALKMPNSKNDINSFFVKHSKKANDANDIALRLLEDSIATVEHIIPINAKGNNRLSNYLCDCRYCNNSRSSTPFDIWTKSLPSGFENRLQEYLQIVQDNVEKGTLEAKYEDYIKDIIAVIKKVTNERIRLALPETQDPIRKNKIFLDRISEIQSYEAQNDSLSKMSHALAQEIAKLKSYEFFDEVYEFFTLEQKLEEFDKMIGEIRNVGSLGYRSVIAQKEALLAQKNQMPDRRKEVLTKISQFAPIAKRIEDLLAQKEKNEKNQKALEKYASIVLELEVKIKALEEENAQISTTGVFSDEEEKAYERYLECKKMLAYVQGIIDTQGYKKLGIPTNDAKKIFNYTNRTLVSEIKTLENESIVRYKTNCVSLKTTQKQLEQNQYELKEKQAIFAQLGVQEKEILQECQGKTIREFLDEYNALKEEAKTIEGIRNIGQKMQKLNKINSQIDSNNAIFKEFKEAFEMSNMTYNALIGQLCFDIN